MNIEQSAEKENHKTNATLQMNTEAKGSPLKIMITYHAMQRHFNGGACNIGILVFVQRWHFS